MYTRVCTCSEHTTSKIHIVSDLATLSDSFTYVVYGSLPLLRWATLSSADNLLECYGGTSTRMLPLLVFPLPESAWRSSGLASRQSRARRLSFCRIVEAPSTTSAQWAGKTHTP